MNDESYYNKHILDRNFKDIKEALDRIETQVIKTNGRVGALEMWKWLLTGGGIVIAITVTPLLIYIWSNSIK